MKALYFDKTVIKVRMSHLKAMKYVLLLFIAFNANAQWSFDVSNNGNAALSADMVFPATYSWNGCDITFDILNGSPFDDVIVSNVNNCLGNHYLVIDGFQYQFPDNFEFTFYSNYLNTFADVGLGVCQTISGDPIIQGSPHLYVEITSFQLDVNFLHHVTVIDGDTYFIVQSANGDIICDGADLIYVHGFEL